MTNHVYTIDQYSADIDSFVQDIDSSATGAISNFVNEMNGLESPARTEAARLADLSGFLENQYRDYAARADQIAENARQMGNPAREQLWNNAAEEMRSWADERFNAPSNEAWLNSRSTSAAADFAEAFGPAARAFGHLGNGVQTAQIVSSAAEGDWDNVGRLSAGWVGGSIGAFALGMALRGLGFLGGPIGVVAGGNYTESELRVGEQRPYKQQHLSAILLA